jgi:DNA invertase Pin-like site-specific DNA recombinase
MGRAVIYTRVSSDKQEDGYSLGVQERDARSYCTRQGHTVEAVESDTYSGHDTLNEREGLRRALRLIKSGQADTFVCWRVDRAGRLMEDNGLLFREVGEAGGSFESVTDGPIPFTPLGKLMLSVHSFAAESEWEGIRQRTQAGLTARIEKGHILVAPVPLYGYRFEGERKETYAIDDESGPILRDIYAKSDDGWSSRRIARWLNAQGIPTPSKLLALRGELPGTRKVAPEWTTQMVLDTLRNPSYTGQHAARRHVTSKERVTLDDGRVVAKMRKRERPQTDEKYQALTIPALVSIEQWERVQEQLNGRHTEREETADAAMLKAAHAICGVCGTRMTAVRRKDWTVRRYMCSDRSGKCTGHGYAIPVPEVDADIWAKVKEIVRDDERYTRLVEGKSSALAARHAEAIERAERTARELADAQEMQATVYARMMSEKNDTIYAMHHAELERLAATVAGLQKRLEAEQGVVADATTKRDTHAALLAKIDSLIAETQAELDGPETPGEAAFLPRVVIQGQHECARMARERLEETTLDALGMEARRGILRLLSVRVDMYPVNHYWSRTNGSRWDFHFGHTVHQAKESC